MRPYGRRHIAEPCYQFRCLLLSVIYFQLIHCLINSFTALLVFPPDVDYLVDHLSRTPELISCFFNYMFKYSIGMKTTFLESLRRKKQKKALKGLDISKTSYNDFVWAQSDFLMLVWAPNESLRLIIIYYTLKYSFSIRKICFSHLGAQKVL